MLVFHVDVILFSEGKRTPDMFGKACARVLGSGSS